MNNQFDKLILQKNPSDANAILYICRFWGNKKLGNFKQDKKRTESMRIYEVFVLRL